MKTADEIEREIHRRFSEQVYTGMSTTDYHAALAHVIARVAAEHLAGEPCFYQVRPYPTPIYASVQNDGPAGAWCTKHGWDCPNMKSRG